MAEDIRHFTVTIPAGTLLAAPVTVPISMPVRVVTRVDWRVPHGPMGTMGWVLTMGGLPVLPTHSFDWVLADGETGYWQVDNYPDGGTWQLTGYNTGAFPHSVYLTFHTDPPRPRPARAGLISAYDLSPAPDLSQAGPPVRGR